MDTDKNIIKRKTQKVLAESPLEIFKDKNEFDNTLSELLELAASAPYHHKCDKKYRNDTDLDSCLPWRIYVLDASTCRVLYEHIEKEQIKAGKISNMLAAADALLMVTWLPDPIKSDKTDLSKDEAEISFEGTIKNMEHIAAASAAIQNILIGATARNIPNYWSSGGQLRMPKLRGYLKISLDEILLGAIFLFPEKLDDLKTTVKEGSLRDQGKELKTWSKWVQLT